MPTKRSTAAKTQKTIKVDFTLPAEIEASQIVLCGDFNDWSTDGIKLDRDSTGQWKTTVGLQAGRAYRYRYLIDGHRWENGWNADRYDPNPYGADDSVVVV